MLSFWAQCSIAQLREQGYSLNLEKYNASITDLFRSRPSLCMPLEEVDISVHATPAGLPGEYHSWQSERYSPLD